MKKTIIEVGFDEKLNENDIIIFKKNRWKAINKDIFLNALYKSYADMDKKIDDEINARVEEITKLQEEIVNLKKVISYLLGDDYETALEQINLEETDDEEQENE